MATIAPFEQPTFHWGAGDVYQEFKRFKQHVEFTFKGPLATADKASKAGWLGMWIGQEGREIYKTFTWAAAEDENDPDVVLNKMETYVKPRKNKRVSRYKAQLRKQLEGESFDNFVKDLRLLLMDCEYTAQDDMLIDLIINGVRHPKVQERLLDRGEDLDLGKAVEIGRQYELSQNQIKVMRGEEVLSVRAQIKEKTHNSVPKSASRSPRPQGQGRKGQNFYRQDTTDRTQECDRCGRTHIKDQCPAKGTYCAFCKKPDHWRRMCRQRRRQIHSVQSQAYRETQATGDTDSDEDHDCLFIHTAQPFTPRVNSEKWVVELLVHQQSIPFRIDTGAKCNLLTKTQLDKICPRVDLQETSTRLKSYSNHAIKSIGCVHLPLAYSQPEVLAKFEIVNLNQENILSGSTAEKLKLIQRIASVDTTSTEHELIHDFPELVATTRTLPGEYRIVIDETVKGVVHPARRLPAAIRPRAIEKLHEMEENGYITRVREPTEWVSSMVVSLRNNKVRICIDPKDLNKAIKREHHPMKTIDDVTTDISGARVFSVLDAKSGFLQIKMDDKSSFLTTFNSPIGRMRWLRLPFGIKSAPEIYQRIMDEMLAGVEGAFAIIDDILIAGRDVSHHDHILREVIKRATNYNLKLNFKKCKIRQSRVTYMGHVISEDGLSADPDKVKAIVEILRPTDKQGVRRFLGMVQYLAKFLPHLSQADAPLRILLKEDIEFMWEQEQEANFQELKRLCSEPPVLAYYDVNKPVEIECDASKDGLGAVITQDNKVIAYTSRSLTETEKRYAQIEKEMLAIVHSTSKFHCYIFGKPTTVFTDHKPLEQLYNKSLLSAPMRIQRWMLKLQWYDLTVKHRKGTEMHVSDALSRAYLPTRPWGRDDDTRDMIAGVEIHLKKHLRMPQVRLNNYLRQEIFTCTYLFAPLSALSVLFAGTVLSLSALSFSRFPLNLNANRVLCFFMMI